MQLGLTISVVTPMVPRTHAAWEREAGVAEIRQGRGSPPTASATPGRSEHVGILADVADQHRGSRYYDPPPRLHGRLHHRGIPPADGTFWCCPYHHPGGDLRQCSTSFGGQDPGVAGSSRGVRAARHRLRRSRPALRRRASGPAGRARHPQPGLRGRTIASPAASTRARRSRVSRSGSAAARPVRCAALLELGDG
ncbi:MAG: hypothetical protein U0802_12750 [Candidatus Binatia bacterium]